jgi:hypothetical protein
MVQFRHIIFFGARLFIWGEPGGLTTYVIWMIWDCIRDINMVIRYLIFF